MAVTFAGCGLQAGASATSPISTLTTSSSLAVGDFLVVLIAYDNSGGGGSDPMTGQISATPATGAVGASVSAQTGHNDPGAASAGLAARCVAFPVTTAIPSGTAVSVSWSAGSIVRYLLLFLKVSGAGYRTNSGATGTNQVNVTAPALTTPSVNSGEAVLCWCGYEYGSGASITADADTTNGTWTAVPGTLYSGSSGSALTGMAAAFQAKVVTATGTQAWNPTGGVASDWILGCLIFTETVPPVDLVVDNAAHTLTSDNVTVEQIVVVNLAVQDAAHATSSTNVTITEVIPNPKVATLTDTFDTEVSLTKWPDSSAQVTSLAGRARIPVTPSNYALQTGLQSGQAYDLTGSSIYAKLFIPGVGNGTRYFYFNVSLQGINPSFNRVYFMVTNTGSLNVALMVNNSGMFSSTPGLYDPVMHSWLRIRESAGTVYWDTSPDGQSWTNYASAANPFWNMGVVAVGFTAGYTGSETLAYAYVDYVNVPEPPPTLVVDDCYHAHVSQQPAEHYLNPALGSASTPDPGTISTDEWTIVSRLYGPIKTLSTDHTLVRQGTASPNLSFRHVRRGVSGGFLIYVYAAGTTSTICNGPSFDYSALTQDLAIAMRHRVGLTTQAAGWISMDGGVTWPTTVSSYDSTEVVRPFDTTSPVIVGNDTGWTGRIYSIEMRLGWGPTAGTVLWRFDVADHVSGTSWTDPRGQTWTLTNAAAAIHVPAQPDVTIIETPAIPLVVQDCQHTFVSQTDMSPWLAPFIGRASTPDPVALPTDGYVFVFKARGPLGSGSGKILVSQSIADPQRSFLIERLGSNGLLYVTHYPSGTTTGSSQIIANVGDTPKDTYPNIDYYSFSYISTTGAYRMTKSVDGGVNYTQTSTGTNVNAPLADSTSEVRVGATGISPWIVDDHIYWVEFRTGTDPKGGTLLWRFDASEWVSGTGWIDARGNVWTLSAAGAIVYPVTDTPTIELYVAPTLVIDDAYHTVDSGTPTLTQNHVLVVQNATHAHVADSPVFTQQHVLAVAGAAHTQVSDSPPLTQVHVLTVAGAAHAQAVDHVAINTATNVPPADAAHAIISDSPAITQVHVLVVANAAHAMTSDAPAFTQVHVLTVAGAAQAHAAATPAITQIHLLVVDSAVHAHTADNVAITQVHLITVQSAEHTTFSPDLGLSTEGVVAGADTYHSVTSSTPTLTQVHNLVVQNALQGHSATSVEIVVNINIPAVASAVHAHVASNVALIVDIPVHSALHAHTADHVPITIRSDLVVASAAHAQTASNVTITQVHVLVVADAVHAQATSGVTLTQVHILAVQSALHAHSADNIDFTQVHFLAAVANAFHAHSADEDLPVTQEHYLTVASALHEHTVDEFAIDYIVWLDVDDAHHALLGPEVNLAGIVTLNEALAMYLGSRAVQAVYLGTSKVWP